MYDAKRHALYGEKLADLSYKSRIADGSRRAEQEDIRLGR
jgi:hypothetical protein